MSKHDCAVLYNRANLTEPPRSRELVYPSTIIRDDVTGIEAALREGGYNPCVISVDAFSKDLVLALQRIAPRFVFNLCEEINKRSELEMCVAGLLEMMNLPYTGSGPLALGLALDKHRVKQLLRAAGIPAPRGYLHIPGGNPRCRGMKFPLFVKPAREDASLGINRDSVCLDEQALQRQVEYIHDVYRQPALVEEFLDGREFNVSVVGNGSAEVLAVSEIDFTGMPEGEPRIVSYQAKWDDESVAYRHTVPVCPAKIPKRLENRLREIALRSYQCIGCRDYGRVDMRTDSRGNTHVLEVNPNPDISPHAGFARAASAAGQSYDAMILRIVGCALERTAQATPAAYAICR